MSVVGESQPEAPFLVHLFYNAGSFIHPDSFVDAASLSSVNVYTWPSCTLQELVYELADARPSPLPSPSIGTRLVFQLVYPDLKGVISIGNGRAKFAVKDLGSVVVGSGGPGAEDEDEHPVDAGKGRAGGIRTLQDAHFAAGDYISCAVLPPLADGSIAPAYDATKSQRPPPRQPMTDQRPAFGSRQHNHDRNFRRGYEDGGPRMPRGDWRAGNNQRQQPNRGRGRGRGRGRW